MAFLPEEIEDAKRRLLQNVTRVREGNTWVEYGSAAELRRAIILAESEQVNSNKPRGTRYAQVSSGY